MDYNELDFHNENLKDDGRVDFDYHQNTDELSYFLDDSDIDQFIDKLNDWD